MGPDAQGLLHYPLTPRALLAGPLGRNGHRHDPRRVGVVLYPPQETRPTGVADRLGQTSDS